MRQVGIEAGTIILNQDVCQFTEITLKVYGPDNYQAASIHIDNAKDFALSCVVPESIS